MGPLDAGWTAEIRYGGWAGPMKGHVLCDGINSSQFLFLVFAGMTLDFKIMMIMRRSCTT
jgi:hypothetical protein